MQKCKHAQCPPGTSRRVASHLAALQRDKYDVQVGVISFNKIVITHLQVAAAVVPNSFRRQRLECSECATC